MARRMRVAVLGAGGMGRTHVSAISHLPERFELAAICDENIDAAVAARDDFGQRALAFDRFEFMLDQMPDIDLVVIAVPHDLLADATILALERNLSVLCEKPGSLNRAEFDRIEAVAQRSQGVYALGFCKRYLRLFEKAEAYVKSGKLGEIYQIVVNDEWRHSHLHDLFATTAATGQSNWRSVAERMGNFGIGNDTTAHSLSGVLALMNGQPYRVMMVDSRDNQSLYLPMEGADTLDFRLSFGEHGRAIGNTSWALNACGEPMLRVQGSEGQLVGYFIKNRKGDAVQEVLEFTQFLGSKNKVTRHTWRKESEIRRQITDIGRCIRSGHEPRNGLSHIREFVELRDQVFGFQAMSEISTAETELTLLAG